MSDPFTQAIIDVVDNRVEDARVIVPGKVTGVRRAEDGELDVDFDPGIGKRDGGIEVADGTVPSAPVMYPCGGGFSMLWPLEVEDEAMGLVVDRNSQRWRQNRELGQAHSLPRSHDISDTFLLPFSLTAPEPAPATPDGDWVLTGPQGEAVRVGGGDGQLTLTKPGDSNAATIIMEPNGSVTITVPTGQSVNIGGAGAGALALADQLVAAIDSFVTALVAAGAGPAYAGATAAQTAWNGAKNTIAAQKAKGE